MRLLSTNMPSSIPGMFTISYSSYSSLMKLSPFKHEALYSQVYQFAQGHHKAWHHEICF